MLPPMKEPRILDIGCGSGIPTLELAGLGQGEVVGIDIDQPALERFVRRIQEAGLTGRVHALNCSMFDMDFQDESFDIIWAEGSIYAIGFATGLRQWRRLLKTGGFLVIHDEQGTVREKLEQISSCGYELLGYFVLSKEAWWTQYFAPLQEWIAECRARCPSDPGILEEIQQAQAELDMYEEYPERKSSVYFVVRKS